MKRRRFRAFRLFLRHWRRSRPHRELLWGLPALLAIVLVMQVGSYLHWKGHHSGSVDRYLRAARTAAATQEWREADLYYRKVLQKSPDHGPTIYELAKVASALRQTARHDSLLERLRSITDDARVPVWVAELVGRAAQDTRDLAVAMLAFEEAERGGMDTSRLRVFLASRYLEMGDHEAVVGLLGDEEEVTAEAGLILAKSWQVLQEPEKAAAVARRVLMSSESVAHHGRRLFQSQAYAIMGDYHRAIGLLATQRHGLEVEGLLADVYGRWLEELNGSIDAVVPQDLVLLEYGLERMISRPELIREFVRFSQRVPQKSLDTAFRDVKAPLLVHVAFGLRAVFADDAVLAGFHLDLAQRFDGRGRAFLLACLEHPLLEKQRGMLLGHVRES